MPEKLTKIESQNKTYKILDTLGEGGTSVVYLANDGSKEVALKILGEEVEPAFKDRYVEILKNEFGVLSKLRHPNIAEVYDFEFSKELNKYFFTTELVKGQDLYNYTATSDYRAKEDLFVQLLVALDYVHRNGLIHCDIKCGNALVTQVKKTTVLKLVDFGFATKGLSQANTVVGTAHYLAPELLVSERKDVDHRVDIYAAGVLFYRLLHRAYPYDASNVNAILQWHRDKNQVAFADDVPEYARQLILKMIATYPSDRIVSCAKAIEFINLRTENRYKKVTEKLAGLQFKEGPLVAREALLASVINIVSDIKAKKTPASPGAVFIGRQGMGKSRFLKEVKYRAELDEVPIREFVCADGKNLVEDFFSRFREIPTSPEYGKAQTEDKKKLLEVEWINKLLELHKDSGLIIIIDDLQFADSSFVKFALLLEERIRVRAIEGVLPVAMLFGTRPQQEMSEIVSQWFVRNQFQKIDLSSFSKEDIKNYALNIGVRDPDRHIEAALAFSGGTPGLVEAYFQHVLSPAGGGKLPESLTQSYIDRAKLVSKDSRNILDHISVARRNLTIKDIEELIKKSREQVDAAIKELVTYGMVSADYSTLTVALMNKAIGQAVKANLKEERLGEIALQLGGWLERQEPQSFAEIAEYYSEAGVREKAFSFAQSAARYFEERFNNSESAKYYSLALKFADTEDKKKELTRLTSRMGILMGNYKDSIGKLEKLIQGNDPSLENYRLLGMACAKMHDLENARKWYETGLSKMTDETAINDIVQFKNSLGNVFFYMGDLEKSEKYFTEAIADATVCLLLNNNLGMILGSKGQYEQAVQFYDARKKYLAAKQNKRALSICHSECGYIHMTHNKFGEAIKELEDSYKLASEIGDWYNILVIVGNLVRCYQQTAQYSKALDYALKGLEIEGSVGSIDEIAQNHLTIGILYETIGIIDLAIQHINMALDRFAALNNRQMIGWGHLAMSYVFKDMDKFAEAMAELEQVSNISKELKSGDLALWGEYTKAELFAEFGKEQEAKLIVGKLGASSGKEFELRKELLELKLGLSPESERIQRFDKLIEKSADFPEMIWEALATKARYLEKTGKTEEAKKAYKASFEAIEAVAKNLSEAYRDTYKSQRFRFKIVEKFQPDFYSKSFKKVERSKEEVFEGKTSEIKN